MPYKIENIAPILREFAFPTVMMWNRVEGRPRATKNFDRALQAEVRDALWMLTKQWQMGEFEGDDAGSPVLAKIRMDTTQLTRYQADSHDVQAFPTDIPLEAQVEQKMLPHDVFNQPISLDLRLMAARRWKRILSEEGILNSYWNFSMEHFGIAQPNPADPNDASICDSAGNLLFYTNGFAVMNGLHDTMLNGGGLNPAPLGSDNWSTTGMPYTQMSIIIPQPGSSNFYF